MIEASAEPLSRRYPVWLCDVWGVVHDGVQAYRAACEALMNHRAGGGTVVLITNAPRPSSSVFPQLDQLGVERECYDAIVTSGDVTRRLIEARAGSSLYHIGPDRDLPLLADLPVTLTGLDEARAVLVTGLIDDENEQPSDYDAQLMAMAERDLDLICANPDRVVRRGRRLVPCGGALAERYEAFGGHVLMAGKPYAPIYEQCLKEASRICGGAVDKASVLAIGDGLGTDVKGAADNGLALAFIAGGIHEEELAGGGPEALAARAEAEAPGVNVTGAMSHLIW